MANRDYGNPDIFIAADNLAKDIKEKTKKETEGVGKPKPKSNK